MVRLLHVNHDGPNSSPRSLALRTMRATLVDVDQCVSPFCSRANHRGKKGGTEGTRRVRECDEHATTSWAEFVDGPAARS